MTLKTQPTKSSVPAFLAGIENPEKRKDCQHLCKIMEEITGAKPVMWGESIVGFGSYHYTYKSGREGDWFLTGFSPRKQNLTIYIMNGFDHYEDYLEKLGKVKTSVSCLYIKKLSDVDKNVLHNLIADSVGFLQNRYNS
jgi:hypothetical protein